MTTSYEVYIAQGCGRCPLGGTPACKVLAMLLCDSAATWGAAATQSGHRIPPCNGPGFR
jgi:hypothetical protein